MFVEKRTQVYVWDKVIKMIRPRDAQIARKDNLNRPRETKFQPKISVTKEGNQITRIVIESITDIMDCDLETFTDRFIILQEIQHLLISLGKEG